VVDERWKVIEKGGLKEAETYQSVPSTRALVLPDVLAHLFYFSSSRDHVEGLSTMDNAGAGFFCFLSFLFPLGLCSKYVRSVLRFPLLVSMSFYQTNAPQGS